jgi:pimeloyl-ACP methyl ester carboxylesterase
LLPICIARALHCGALLSGLLTTGLASAQVPYLVGVHDVAWANTVGIGSAILLARVSYPATAAGQDAPVLPSPTGWPVVVFLHGYGRIGSDYSLLAKAWAERGFAVVALDTARFDFVLQEADAIATHGLLPAANVAPGTLLTGAFDTQNMLVAGHSMGGGVAALVLAANPGYRAGFALAPFDPTSIVGPVVSAVSVPFGMVVGDGDMVTPLSQHAQPLFDTLGLPAGVKFLARFDAGSDHLGIAGLVTTSPAQDFFSAITISAGFFSHTLRVRADGLDECIGPTAQSDPLLVSLVQQIGLPQAWHRNALRIGTQIRFSAAVEPGIGALIASSMLIPGVPTPFGELLLDPSAAVVGAFGVVGAERRLDWPLALPNDPLLVGTSLAVQSFGASASQPTRLGAALQLTVQH